MPASTDEIERVYHARYGGFRRGVAAIVGEDAAHDAMQEGFTRWAAVLTNPSRP